MSHINRIMTEQIGQGLGILAGLFDRIVLTGLLFRLWGASLFEVWSVCLAIAGLVSLFEFGFNLYFNNRLMAEMEQGQVEAARDTYFAANAVFAVSAALSVIFVAAFAWKVPPQGATGSDILWGVIALAVGSAARLAASGSYALYRANRRYSRFALLMAASELTRAVLVIATVAAGGGLLTACLVAALCQVVLQFGWVILDTNRLFQPHRFGFARPARRELPEIAAISGGYFAQNVPLILLSSVPVIALGHLGLDMGVLAGFVLLRTLSGLPRTILQAISIVFGQELGRRLATHDQAGAANLTGESGRMLGALSGLAAGLLIGGGDAIVRLWTGSGGVYRLDLLVAAILPMLAIAASILAHNVLAASQAPFYAAIGRWAQLALSAVLALTLPVEDVSLRMLLALSLGEILGFAPLAYVGMARLVDAARFGFHVRVVAVTLVATGLAALTTRICLQFVGTAPVFTAIGLLSAIALCGLALPFLGMSAAARETVLARTLRPLVRRVFQSSKPEGGP